MALRVSQEARAAFKNASNGKRQQLPNPRSGSQRIAVEEHATLLLDEARHLRSRGLLQENTIGSTPNAHECKISFLFLAIVQ